MLFLEIISWKGVSCLKGGRGGSDGGEGFIFNGGGCPMVGASVLVGGFSEKNRKMGDVPMPPTPHYGKPLIKTYKELLYLHHIKNINTVCSKSASKHSLNCFAIFGSSACQGQHVFSMSFLTCTAP